MSHFLCRVSAQRSTFSCRRLVLSLMMRASSDWSLEVVTTLQNKATTSFRFLQMPSAESSSEAVQRCHCNQLSHEASHCKCAFHKNLHFTGNSTISTVMSTCKVNKFRGQAKGWMAQMHYPRERKEKGTTSRGH